MRDPYYINKDNRLVVNNIDITDSFLEILLLFSERITKKYRKFEVKNENVRINIERK